MRIGVIGAGPSGLAVGRRVTEDMPGSDFIIFEQTDCVGGTWVYTEEQFKDEYGLPIHSSMYKSLRTNIPKETMEFLGFPYDKRHNGYSYLHAADIVQYIEQYVEHFQLAKHIKLRHLVTSVQPLPDEKWRITVTDLVKDKKEQFDFDAVFICNGHLHRPNHIQIEGQDFFEGSQLHSHHYRRPEPYKDKCVLVIGSGPSGIDISCELASVAKCVYLSHHDPSVSGMSLPDKLIKKPDVLCLKEKFVEFVDGSISHVDTIIYCTGYKINLPFLTADCGLEISDISVDPLFVDIVNINRPTMFFIGLVNHSFLFPLFEMQAQFCMHVLNGSISLPVKEDMLKCWKAEDTAVQMKTREPHSLIGKVETYHNFIHEFAKTNIYEPVVLKIYKDCASQKKSHILNYQSDFYTVIDEENFHRTSVSGSK